MLRFALDMSPRRKLLALFFAGMLVLHAIVAWRSSELVRKGYPDFTIFYSAGKMVREGFGHQLYDEATQYRVQQEFAAGVSIRHGALPYNHPPFEALLLLPFTYLPYLAAYLCWDAFNLFLLGWLARALRPHIALLREASPLLWTIAACCFFPIFISLLQGQDMILFLALLGAVFIGLQRNSDVPAGAFLALMTFRPHLVIPLLLFVVWRKRWRVLAGFVPVSIVLLLVSLAVVGWQSVIAYPAYVLHIERIMGRGSIVPSDMPNIRGLADTFLAGLSPTVSHIITLLASAAVFLVAASSTRGDPRISRLDFSLWVITTILVSYHAFAYDLTLLVIPILVIADHCRIGERAGLFKMSLVLPIVLLLISPLQMILLLRYGLLSLMSIPILFWWWAVLREVRTIEVPA